MSDLPDPRKILGDSRPKRAASVDRGNDSIAIRSLEALHVREAKAKEIAATLKPRLEEVTPPVIKYITPIKRPLSVLPIWDESGRLLNPPGSDADLPDSTACPTPQSLIPSSYMNRRSRDLACKHQGNHALFIPPSERAAPVVRRRSQSVLSSRQFGEFILRQRQSAINRDTAIEHGNNRPPTGSCMTPRSVQLVKVLAERSESHAKTPQRNGKCAARTDSRKAEKLEKLEREVRKVEASGGLDERGANFVSQRAKRATPIRRKLPSREAATASVRM
jgi:hypothetical protein